MKIIALTGTIGSGKSTVSGILRELGAVVIDSDKVAHEVRDRATDEVAAALGREILNSEGKIDRQKLADLVFHDRQALFKLNNIIHPKVDAEIYRRMDTLTKQGVRYVFIEIPLISRADWYEQAEQTWVVKAGEEITLKRLRKRGLTEDEARARLANQKPPEEQVKRGLVIINNDGDMQDLRRKVEKLWKDLHNER